MCCVFAWTPRGRISHHTTGPNFRAKTICSLGNASCDLVSSRGQFSQVFAAPRDFHLESRERFAPSSHASHNCAKLPKVLNNSCLPFTLLSFNFWQRAAAHTFGSEVQGLNPQTKSTLIVHRKGQQASQLRLCEKVWQWFTPWAINHRLRNLTTFYCQTFKLIWAKRKLADKRFYYLTKNGNFTAD